MDVSDTVHTVRLRFDLKMQSHSEKIAPCERSFKGINTFDVPAEFCQQNMYWS